MALSEQVPAPTPHERSLPVLETERLVLRAPRPQDAPAIVRLAGDLRISQNTSRIPHPYGLADARQFITSANCQDGEATFVITLDEAVIGACGIEPRDGVPELGYWLGLPHWGQGYATEAVRGVIDHVFGYLRLEALQAGARVSNPASRRVLEKCGFQWTGVRLLRIRAINSAAPADRFRLDRRLWESLRSWGRARRVA